MSTLVASPADPGSAPVGGVRALQHALYRAAKADPGRRFHSPRAWSTTQPPSSARSSMKPSVVTPPTSAPGSPSSTGPGIRSTASRPKPKPAESRSPSSATSSTYSSTSGPRPGRSSPKPTRMPKPGSARKPSGSSTGKPARSPPRSAAKPPASTSIPTRDATPTSAPTTCSPRGTTSTTRRHWQPAGRSPPASSKAPADTS